MAEKVTQINTNFKSILSHTGALNSFHTCTNKKHDQLFETIHTHLLVSSGSALILNKVWNHIFFVGDLCVVDKQFSLKKSRLCFVRDIPPLHRQNTLDIDINYIIN